VPKMPPPHMQSLPQNLKQQTQQRAAYQLE